MKIRRYKLLSTKYYNGYKLPKDKLCDFMDLLDEKCLPIIEDFVFDLYKRLSDSVVDTYCETHNLDLEMCSGEWLRELALFNLIREGTESREIDVFSVGAEWNFWLDDDKDYVLAYQYGSDWMYKELEYPDYLEFYGYWDNSDRPEEASDKEWKERQKEWDYISNNWDKGRVSHMIMGVDSERWYQLKTKLRERVLDEEGENNS